MSKVLTVGTFDMPHSGHLELFKKCRKIADLIGIVDRVNHKYTGEVVVGVNSDQFVNYFKNKFPVYSQNERLSIISSLKDVNRVLLNDQYTLQYLLAKEKPDFLVVGSDWAKKDYYKQIGVTKEWLEQYNITLLYVEYTDNISSTLLKERLLNS